MVSIGRGYASVTTSGSARSCASMHGDMTERRLPRPGALAELLVFRRPTWNPTTRRLARAHTIADLRDIARRVTP